MTLLVRGARGVRGLLTPAADAPATDAAAAARPAPNRSELRRDAALAVGLFVAAVLSVALSTVSQLFTFRDDSGAWPLVFAALGTLPLALRRRFPLTIGVVIAAVYFVGASLEATELYVSQVTVFIAFYTVGAWATDRRRATWGRALIIIGMFIWLLVSTYAGAVNPDERMPDASPGAFSPYVAYMLILWLINIAYFGGAWYLGDHAYAAALDREALRRRTRELEEEREMSAAQAVALDRVRIARELHDVVAHHVSAMGVQAAAARTVMDRDPSGARDILQSVEGSARSALRELHLLLDTLRSGEGADDSGSTLRLDDLKDLAREASAAGTPTTLTVVGEPREVPETVHVNLYRIAQEALTNTRRHAGPDATADLRLRYLADAVELEVTDTGRTAAHARPGLGQLGMRERAIASGGSLEARPRDRGGYLVRVRVPSGGAG
ncbi:sensor histidine kinase [Microbacterium stercoris]|uniref:histidine kinase n=1 Tax=Microbacterium stercoris TaxID=2820289 RepID=A0A939TL92_9MICO|nr:histidine kinase [Microbacterium stercoris]MBO3661888.1 sensor histidine kinase [Microbacterium stercoris]